MIWSRQSRMFCPLHFHMASLCYFVTVILIWLQLHTHFGNGWLLSWIGFYAVFISPHHPPALIPVDWIASRSVRTLQWIFRRRIWFTWIIGIAQESKLFSILNTGIILLQKNSRQFIMCFIFLPGTHLSIPQVAFPVGISEILNCSQRVVFH